MTKKNQLHNSMVILNRTSEVSTQRKIKNLIWRAVNRILFPLTFRSHAARRVLLRIFGASIGSNVRISARCRIEYPNNIHIGDNSSIGNDCYVQGLDQIKIGSNVCISDGVYLLTGSHDLASLNFALITHPVSLGDGVWLAVRAIVLPGVTLQRGTVVGAGSVVHKSFESFSIVAGNPAVKLRTRNLNS